MELKSEGAIVIRVRFSVAFADSLAVDGRGWRLKALFRRADSLTGT